MGKSYILTVLSPFFKKNNFERELSFDLKNEEQDQVNFFFFIFIIICSHLIQSNS